MPLAFGLTCYLKGRVGLDIPLLAHVQVDAAALFFTAIVAFIAGLAFGTIPALKLSSRGLHATLEEHNRGSTDGRHAWVRSSLVVIRRWAFPSKRDANSRRRTACPIGSREPAGAGNRRAHGAWRDGRQSRPTARRRHFAPRGDWHRPGPDHLARPGALDRLAAVQHLADRSGHLRRHRAGADPHRDRGGRRPRPPGRADRPDVGAARRPVSAARSHCTIRSAATASGICRVASEFQT